jgi:hypothetical protein
VLLQLRTDEESKDISRRWRMLLLQKEK